MKKRKRKRKWTWLYQYVKTRNKTTKRPYQSICILHYKY